MRELEMRTRVARFLRLHRRGSLLAVLGAGASIGAYEIFRPLPPVTAVYSAQLTRENVCRAWLSQGHYMDPPSREFCGLPSVDAGTLDEPDARGGTNQSGFRSGVHRRPKNRGLDRNE